MSKQTTKQKIYDRRRRALLALLDYSKLKGGEEQLDKLLFELLVDLMHLGDKRGMPDFKLCLMSAEFQHIREKSGFKPIPAVGLDFKFETPRKGD